MGEMGSASGGALAAGCPGGVGAVAGQKFGWRGSGDVALGNDTGSTGHGGPACLAAMPHPRPRAARGRRSPPQWQELRESVGARSSTRTRISGAAGFGLVGWGWCYVGRWVSGHSSVIVT